jgi:hypothetical protein
MVCFDNEGGLAAHFTCEPAFREVPIAEYCLRRHFEDGSRLFYAQARKEAQLDDTGFPGIQCGKGIQGIIQPHELGVTVRNSDPRFVEGYAAISAASLYGAAGESVIHKNPTHDLRRNGKEMRAVFVSHILRVNKPEEGFVHEGSGLQCMLFPFSGQAPSSNALQFIMQDRQELVERAGIARRPRF